MIGVLVQGNLSSRFEAAFNTASTKGSRGRLKTNRLRRPPKVKDHAHALPPFPLVQCDNVASCERSNDILGRCMRAVDGLTGETAYSGSSPIVSSSCQNAAAADFACTCPLVRGRNEVRPRIRRRRSRQYWCTSNAMSVSTANGRYTPLYARIGTGRKHDACAIVAGGGGASGSDDASVGGGGTSERSWNPTEGRPSTGEKERRVTSGMNVSVLSIGSVCRISQ